MFLLLINFNSNPSIFGWKNIQMLFVCFVACLIFKGSISINRLKRLQQNSMPKYQGNRFILFYWESIQMSCHFYHCSAVKIINYFFCLILIMEILNSSEKCFYFDVFKIACCFFHLILMTMLSALVAKSNNCIKLTIY